ncbi:uncharacterized protein LOC119172268 isoform X2 [Rhipicephalus microplus]|uniref:uncharacterized protein LOC119172268 isoform X2 n=1 Tax=Rhipicephalus microplus TaxID=6941 RepID=UPI003F6D6F01
MATTEKGNGTTEVAAGQKNGDEPADKRKRPLRFSGQQDIQLLQEVVSLNPFKDTPPTTAWAAISRNLDSVLKISSRRCRERTILMLDQYIKGDLASLQRFCTKDELAVKEQLLHQVLQQYESGAGGYSSRIGSGVSTAPQAAAVQEDDNEDFDLYRPRIILHEDSTPEHSDNHEPSSEQDRDDKQALSPKRPRFMDDEMLIEEMRVAAAATAAAAAAEDGAASAEAAMKAADGISAAAEAPHVARSAGAGDFPMQVITYLLTRQAKEAQVRERELKIRQEEVQLEKARLKLQEDNLALEKARFEIERQEREQRLRSELQDRSVFMEVLKKVFSNGLGGI